MKSEKEIDDWSPTMRDLTDAELDRLVRAGHATTLGNIASFKHPERARESVRAVVAELHRVYEGKPEPVYPKPPSLTPTRNNANRFTWMDMEQKHGYHYGDCGDPTCHYSSSWDGVIRLRKENTT
jgi:hypothetical protein